MAAFAPSNCRIVADQVRFNGDSGAGNKHCLPKSFCLIGLYKGLCQLNNRIVEHMGILRYT